MWGLDRFQRPAWSTGTLIPCSFLCGISAAVFIWRGGQKTKRVAKVEERLRAALRAQDNEDLKHNAGPNYLRPNLGEKMVQVTEVEESETAIDEQMTIPSIPSSQGHKDLSPMS
ncbi:hypothetical protein H0H81_004929 [Sphagnurus paluster]|uniref:Uncharacterized protein n=1 Tax=Sphagnurus paluster TaxID=117069 RepID=A0A9P7K6U9_9AGAR|nr:hypothetical protein H0H81_004929 [Sphagnurus paluster]